MKHKFIFLLSIFALPQLSFAEVQCRMEVTYSWRKAPPAPEKGEKKEAAPAEAKSLEVFFTAHEKKGAAEDVVKRELEALGSGEKGKALEDCKKAHENVADCVVRKHTVMDSVLDRLSFSARKSLEDSIVSDCSAQQGTCEEAKVSEIKCVQLTDGAAEGAAGEGDKKKKK